MLSTQSTSHSHLFFSNHPPTTEIYTLSLHDALPILEDVQRGQHVETADVADVGPDRGTRATHLIVLKEIRSEEHTSELQSLRHLVCRLLLEKKKDMYYEEMTKRRQRRLCIIVSRSER